MKKMHAIALGIGVTVLCIIVTFIILWLSGVFDRSTKPTIKAVDAYSALRDLPIEIEVQMDDEYIGTFTVNKDEQIKQIYDLVTSMEYHYYDESIPPGSNTFLKFIYPNEAVIYISSRSIKFNGESYLADNYRELDNLLVSMGLDGGFITVR